MPTREDRIASLSRLLQEERRTTYNLRAALGLEQVRREKMERISCCGCNEKIGPEDLVYCSEDFEAMSARLDKWQDEAIRLRHWFERINDGIGTTDLRIPALRLIKAKIGMALKGDKP